jgi:hypothetical protein
MPLKSRVRTNFGLILAILAGLCAASTALPQRNVVVDAAHCVRLSDVQRHWLPADWQPFAEYTRICSVHNSEHEAVLFLVSVHADLYYRAQLSSTVHQVELPHPLLLLPSGAVSGSLPYNFPDDPPAELRVSFAKWQHGFPQRIDLYLTDPRAAGNRSLPPLAWDPAQRQFLPQEGNAGTEEKIKNHD